MTYFKWSKSNKTKGATTWLNLNPLCIRYNFIKDIQKTSFKRLLKKKSHLWMWDMNNNGTFFKSNILRVNNTCWYHWLTYRSRKMKMQKKKSFKKFIKNQNFIKIKTFRLTVHFKKVNIFVWEIIILMIHKFSNIHDVQNTFYIHPWRAKHVL